MVDIQQGDVELFQTNDGGDISVTGGVVKMGGGLETTAYLAMFGGNEEDDGSQDNVAQWWGNLDETVPSKKYRSETQNLVESLPLTSGNLRRVEDAASRDLEFLLELKIASSVTVEASIPRVNTLGLRVTIEADGVETEFNFTENWKAAT